MLAALFRITTLLIISSLCTAGCAGAAPPTPAPAQAPAAQPTQAPSTDTERIDSKMREAMSGSIAHNAPSSMHIEDTVEIQVLVSPSISPDELKKQMNASGPVITASLSVTSRMKAELIPANPDAFYIQPVHDNPIQLLPSTEPTEWKWLVTARQEGSQLLDLTVYRLIEYDGQESWRQVKSYEDVINVDVTLPQRLARFDWQWLVGLVLIGIVFPALVIWWKKRQGG